MKKRVLFVCIHNSARSQMAEEYLKRTAGDRYEVESAGLEPTEIHPLTIEVMKEEGIDLTGKKTNNAFEYYRTGRKYDFVIVVCNRETEKRCFH
jgi:arsenate reductase